MQKLNLPKFEPKLKDQEVFCLVRRKWVNLTSEEWVRQHFLNLMINHLAYPKGMMRIEHSMTYFKNIRRSDITILSKHNDIFLLLECKAPSIKINQKVINQISEYNKVLKAQFIAISNGINHFIWERKGSEYFQSKEFPIYK
ncbi:MAG: type I restriction enzyme HsdR N-terminal domain-containing protein [Ekhidna sp.]|nr:type I restriction enzyme HsdR N-terminal domain-containing protein [Ekhidna sp.]MBC6409142.1 type I restriction enzyme HsdR N-terminal domain-containing protein [Ekhidna sp.]MBC6426063.1 type I restriction enzyme HsdR N-terminal domain-containing protein [Ekhidna sp.]